MGTGSPPLGSGIPTARSQDGLAGRWLHPPWGREAQSSCSNAGGCTPAHCWATDQRRSLAREGEGTCKAVRREGKWEQFLERRACVTG